MSRYARDTAGRAATDGFAKACDHAWHWTGTGFACVTCSLRTTEPQALADLGEPTERTT